MTARNETPAPDPDDATRGDAALASGASKPEAARRAGVGRGSVYRRPDGRPLPQRSSS